MYAIKKIIAAITVALILLQPAVAREQMPPTAGEMIVDAAVVRPMMAGTTIIGTGIFLVTLPFSLLGGNVGESAEKFVADPAYETLGRCLGCN